MFLPGRVAPRALLISVCCQQAEAGVTALTATPPRPHRKHSFALFTAGAEWPRESDSCAFGQTLAQPWAYAQNASHSSLAAVEDAFRGRGCAVLEEDGGVLSLPSAGRSPEEAPLAVCCCPASLKTATAASRRSACASSEADADEAC